jgi:hypothetical protein
LDVDLAEVNKVFREVSLIYGDFEIEEGATVIEVDIST